MIITGLFRVSLFIDLDSLNDLGTGPRHFYDKYNIFNKAVVGGNLAFEI